MAQIRKGTTYATGDQVTATNLNTHVDGAILLPGAVTEQPTGTANSGDYVLAADSSLKKLTVAQLQAGGIRADGTVAMTGELQLSSSTPSAALKAASKGYVDTTTAALDVDGKVAQKIARSGDTMSGALVLAGNAASALQAVPLQQLQSYANGTASLSANGYQTLPNGLLLQWGSISSVPASTTQTFNFNTPFTSSVFIVIASFGVAITNTYGVGADAINNNQFNVTNSDGAARPVRWFAIGV
jgi:hypothetical protein